MNSNKEVHTDGGSTYKSFLIRFPNTKFVYNPFTSIRVATCTRPTDVNRKTSYVFTQWFQIRLFDIHIEAPTFTSNHTNPLFWRVLLTDLHSLTHVSHQTFTYRTNTREILQAALHSPTSFAQYSRPTQFPNRSSTERTKYSLFLQPDIRDFKLLRL
jgi:hypothetical protein